MYHLGCLKTSAKIMWMLYLFLMRSLPNFYTNMNLIFYMDIVTNLHVTATTLEVLILNFCKTNHNQKLKDDAVNVGLHIVG